MKNNGPVDSLSKQNKGEIIDQASFEKRMNSGESLRIKFGADPTKPDLHLGHAVALRKLKELQDKGHKIIFLIGDFTAKVGDPSGRNTARPVLSDEQIKTNTKTYLDQVGKILDVKKCEIRYNSEWYGKMDFAHLLEIVGKVTVAQVLERDDFAKRIENNKDVFINEVLYPVMQGYDSVVLKSDIEVGGQDQKLNMLMGRDLQRKYSQKEQDVLIVPLLVGIDGKKKMSKSYDNYVAICEDKDKQFGKIMSIPDFAIGDYLELAADFSPSEIEEIKKQLSQGENPKIIKERIAQRVVQMYQGEKEAQSARENFDKVHKQKELPENIEEKIIREKSLNILDLLTTVGLSKSKSEALRLVLQGGVKINQSKILDPKSVVELKDGTVLQVGKLKFLKVKSEN